MDGELPGGTTALNKRVRVHTTVINMIEIFKTNVREECKNDLLKILSENFPHFTFNFDLEDCDKILRVKGAVICTVAIAAFVREQDFICEVIND